MATYTNIPTFTAGQILRADGDGSTYAGMNDLKNNLDLTNAQSQAFSRNLLYNGVMQVAQRNTSVVGITTGNYYTADRWTIGISSLGTWTQSVENDAPTGSGIRKSLKMLCNTADAAPAAGDYLAVQQLIEGYDVQRIAKGTSSAQQLTLTFWVKSNVTGTYIAELVDNDNSRSVSKSYTVSASGTWEKKEIVFPADTTGAFDNDNAASLTLNLWLGAGTTFTSGTLATTWASTTSANRVVGQTNLAAATSNYWQVTGVQLEVGSVSTPFEFLPYGDELRRCQRYHFRVTATSVSQEVGTGFNTTTTAGTWIIPFPTSMRVAPSSIETNGTVNDFRIRYLTSTSLVQSLPSFASSTTENVRITSGRTGLTAGQGSIFMIEPPGIYIAVSAEL